MNKEEVLSQFYFNIRNPGSYSGPKTLYKTLQKSNIGFQYSLGYIKRWLRRQDSYTLHRPVRHRFKTAKVVVGGLHQQYDIDLSDVQNLTKYNDGIRYLLFIIDVFSRYLRVITLRNKTAKEILRALKSVFASGAKVKKVRSDRGSEFNNQYVKKYLKSIHVKYFTTNNPPKASVVERVQRTIKERLYRYFTKARSYRYVDEIQSIVDNYNNTGHRSLGYLTPSEITKENEADIWSYLYLRNSGENRPRIKSKVKVSKFKFKTGDLVRLSYTKHIFRRAYQQQWTSEIFKIKSRFLMQGIPLYTISDFHNKTITGNFYQSELAAVSKSEDALWIIEKKIRRRIRNGVVEWLVKFEGWPNTFNEWLKETELQDVSTEK